MVTETSAAFSIENGNDQDALKFLAITYKVGADISRLLSVNPALLRSVVDGSGPGSTICFDDLHSVGVSEQTAPGRRLASPEMN